MYTAPLFLTSVLDGGEFHAPVTLLPGKVSPVKLGKRLIVPQSRCKHCGVETNFYPIAIGTELTRLLL
jgi:hypothetical protein